MFSPISLVAASALIASAAAIPVRRQAAQWQSLSSKITHVVYLMMENHSFDNIAGD